MWPNIMLPYALGFPETYTVVLKGQDKPIALKRVEGKITPRSNPIYYCPDGLCLELLGTAAVLKWPVFICCGICPQSHFYIVPMTG